MEGESKGIRKLTILMLISLLIVSQNLGVFSLGQVAEANPGDAVPIEFGDTLSGSIDVAGEKDAYVFSANASDVVLVRVRGFWPGIRLYSPNGTKLKGASGFNGAELSYTLPDDGEYKILVYMVSMTGGYTIYLQRLNNPANAIPIEFGDTLSGSIDAAAEMDTYVFSANASDVVLVRVRGFWPGIRLYSPNGTKLKGASGFNGAELSYTLPDDGEYKILVYMVSMTGGYTIYLQSLINPANATPIEFGETLSGSIYPAGEMDTYVFSANASDVVLVRVVGLLYPGIRLYSPNGTKLKGASGRSDAKFSSVLPDDGEYKILVYDTGVFGPATGSYKLSLKSMMPEQLEFDEPFADSISSGEWRYYKVDTEADKNLLVSLEPKSSTGSLELYGRYGQIPTRSNYDCIARKRNVLGNYELLISPTEEGTYYINVYGKDVEDTLSYNITASILDRHVSDIYPRSVTNSEKSIVHIKGIGFTNGMRVELRNASALNIPAQSVIFSSSQMIVAHFNLSDASLGLYDISVIWPDDYEKTIEGAVEVNELQEGALYSFLFEISKGSTLTYDIEVPQTQNLFVTLQKTTLVSYGNSWSGKLSLLQGGEEIASDSGSHDLILHIVDPDPGPYNVSITSNQAGEGILTVWTSLPELPLGEWVVGTIYCSYGSVWYQVEVPPDQDALYFEAEAMGLWSHFDIYYGEYGSSEHWVSPQGTRASLQIPSPDPGVYIVQFLDSAMLYGRGGLGAGWLMDQSRDVLIKADTKESVTAPPGYQPFINSLSPDRGGNTGLVTVEIKGGWLDPDATVSLVHPDYEDIIAQSTCGSSSGTTLTATFNLIGKEPGEWNLVVANPDGQNATAPSSVTIKEGGEPELWVEIVGREKIRVGRPTQYILRYGNDGDVDMPAPLFIVSSSPEVPLRTQDQEFKDGPLKVLGTGSSGSPGILRPGSSYSIPIYMKSQDTGAIIDLRVSTSPQYEYDEDFNIIRATDPLGNTYDFSYDDRGNIVSVTNPLNHEITMGYDLNFNKFAWIRDALGNEVTFDYDEHGNLLSITYPDSSTEFMDYDSAGNLITETTRKGDIINCTYNDRGQLIRKDYPDGSWIAYEYDDAGNMISATDESGTIEMEYNKRNLVTKVTYLTGYFFNYSYDDAGRLIQRVDQDGNVLNYEYDDASRLVRVSDGSDSDIVRYEYDAVGRLSKKSLSNGAYTTYEYDAAGQILLLINYDPSGEVLSRFDYTYDLQGNPISITKLEGTYRYEYDDIGQLTKVTYPDGHYISYSYDAAGNRIAVVDDGKTTTYTTNNMNQYTEVGNVSYSYDANGNLISKVEDGQTTTYQYDFENRLTKVTSPEGTWEYIYDALGDRVGVIHNGIERRYLVDPTGLGNVVAEYDGEGNLIARYIHGLGLISSIDSGGNPYYYHFNPTGHTMEITDEDGNVVNSYKYSPFGIYLKKEETIPNPFGYVGEFGVMDDGNGLNYMRLRYYQPEVGRFLSEDSIWRIYNTQSSNKYMYARNNPLSYVDPSGMFPHAIILAIFYFAANTLVLFVRLPAAEKAEPLLFRRARQQSGPLAQWLQHLGVYEFLSPYEKMLKGVIYSPTIITQQLLKYLSVLIDVVYSTTPEDKYGPAGFDLPDAPYEERKRFVPADQNFYYKVDFWNKENATAPACDVFVKDQLDTNLDWSTFRFEEIGFLKWTVDLEPCQYFSVNVDMRPEIDLIVNVEGTFDPETGEIEWVFRSLDPDTMDTPEDPMAGFLPPITESGYEIGWVCFSVDPKAGLPTETQITNQAFVKFDVGDFHPAPKEGPFVNTIDAAPPTSSVTATLNGETIQLNWTGNDLNGSGIKDYTIYLSEDGNPYEPWLLHTTNSSAVFVGESGHIYAFYSIARDNVGNIEEAPAEPDVIITVDSSSPATLHDYDSLWYTTDFIITLTATDDFSGVAETYYKINHGPTKTVSVNGQPYITTESGNNTLEYWSVDNAGNEEIPHKILTGIKLDKTAPTGSIRINNDAAYANSTLVTLALTAIDATSGVAQMRFSLDNITWTPWETYASSKAWTLTTDDGTKIVYVQFIDNAGSISQQYQDTITLDTTPPTISIVSPENKTYAVEDVPLTFTASESTSWIGYSLDGQANITIAGNTTLYGLSDGSHSIVVYAKDTAGNTGASETIHFSIETPPAEPFPIWIVAVIVIIAALGTAVYLLKIRRKS